MKIAAISDIHGNIDALNAVLDDIKEQNCKQIFILGDYAMAGPEPTKVVDFFMQKEGDPTFKMIQGNTDLMISDYTELYVQTAYGLPKDTPYPRQAPECTASFQSSMSANSYNTATEKDNKIHHSLH